ncbi:predicted protein [Botrytis cinerea T4]|uniref:Uncharacterized protein n=1 Tax=Botryotinia fuckeliana (strain T4) TaxID=999810 RepID=G2YJ14_BOTF4|nr:predicted protein [Botrytis cinerea T4]
MFTSSVHISLAVQVDTTFIHTQIHSTEIPRTIAGHLHRIHTPIVTPLTPEEDPSDPTLRT